MMLTATRAFLEPLEQWVKAVHEGDFAAANASAEHLLKAGELLAIRPDFKAAFQAHCKGVDEQQALFHLCQFLICTADARAALLKKDPGHHQQGQW